MKLKILKTLEVKDGRHYLDSIPKEDYF